ncbi:hypothetical protein ACFWEJ_22810 [Promicromonospora sp. NPDC060204]|uniref:hypothetical protein n=1 Tax=Promicromonospora sp. NPDC060204 TaxID=3347071 RepID=UPI003665BC9D
MVYLVSAFEIEVQPVDGVGPDGNDQVSLEFRATDGAGRTLWFAIFRGEDESADVAQLTIDPQSRAIPLAVVEWAVGFARTHL